MTKTRIGGKLLSLLLTLCMALALLPTAALATETLIVGSTRFHTGYVGLAATSGSIVLDPDNQTITMTAGNGIDISGGELADSEDSFLYYYTEINPATENFTLTGTFTVKAAAENINQSGFGVMAVDTFANGNSAHRYFNSAGCMVRKYSRTVDGAPESKSGIPGGYFVTGNTGASNVYSTNCKTIDTAPFNWDAASFGTNSVYTLTLKKDNTGFHAIMVVDGEENEVLCYEPELLLKQDTAKYYVGFAVARKITVEISNIQFSTTDPETDPDRISRPPTPVTPTCTFTTASTSPSADYEAGFTADYKGTLDVYNSRNELVVGGIDVDPTKNDDSFIATADLTLAKGDNEFHAVFTPGNDAAQVGLLKDGETIVTTPITVPFTVSCRQYGTSANCIYVSNSGTADGTGSKNSPLDIYTAVAYAQPGQEIVLAGGTYNLTKPLNIERGHSGTADQPIIIMSAPGTRAVLDGAGYYGNIINLSGDYWHLYDLEVKNAKNNCKGVQISGNHNIVEKLTVSGCGSTGIHISGNATEPRSLWPANNLVLSCESYNNCDTAKTDADGFAAKLTVGEGNIFRYCIAHHNIDDGWDLYAKTTPGTIGVVIIDQCVAYANGKLLDDDTTTGEGNGFKLGGESIPVAHVLTNSIAYNNRNNGVYSNTNPGCQITNVTSYANGCNLKLNATTATTTTTWLLDGFISHGVAGTADGISVKNQATLASSTNYLDRKNSEGDEVEDEWFESLDTEVVPTFAEDGAIDMHGLLTLTSSAPSGVGAVMSVNPSPTVIEIGDEIISQTGGSPSGGSSTPTPKVPVIVDGEEYNIGTSKTESGVTTVTVDQTELQKQLDSASENVVIPVAPGANADTVTAKLVVANVDDMAEKEMTLSVQVDNVSYDLPAVAVNTGDLLKELGATDPTKVPVDVTIKELAKDDVTLETGELMLPPVEFTVTASYGGKSTEVDTFEKYVQRVIEVPGGVDAGKITTAVVVESGKQRHVPTEVFQKDGKWYAKINSLTNSVYALINNEQSFSDAGGKWFEAVVTEMASRGIINGRDEKSFDGDGNITRAEFAAIAVRALGLPANGTCTFTDVSESAWYYGAVGTAVEYGLVSGRTASTYDPDSYITRQEAMQMIYNASAIAPIELLSGINPGQYTDSNEVSDWAKDAADFNLLNGLMVGSNGYIRPTDTITRAETATVVLRLLQKAALVDTRIKA